MGKGDYDYLEIYNLKYSCLFAPPGGGVFEREQTQQQIKRLQFNELRVILLCCASRVVAKTQKTVDLSG